MKRFFLLVILVAFAATPNFCVAQATKEKGPKLEEYICCCIDGKCKWRGSRAACIEDKGTVEVEKEFLCGDKLTCCIKGKCNDNMTKYDCKKENGKVVRDCSKCRPLACCIKGKCEEGMTKAECKKENGKVVGGCSKCKPSKGPVKR
jgi:hypothetical protein